MTDTAQNPGEAPQPLPPGADLPRGDDAWVAAAEAELFGGLTRDLPAVPAQRFAGAVSRLSVADKDTLLRQLLDARAAQLGAGTVDDEPAEDWPFDPMTGTPHTPAPEIPGPLAEALFRAARGERVHPQCAPVLPDGSLPDGRVCDCPEHTTRDHPSTQRFAPGPRITDWRKQATTNALTLFAWWSRWPTSAVGTAGGSFAGVRGRGPVATKRTEAMTFLGGLVNEHGTPAVKVYKLGRDVGLSERTLNRAADEMGIRKRQDSVGFWEWYWSPAAIRRFMARGQGDGTETC
ncbi:MAG TPA: hypothetical protein VJN62_02310 [Gemmatimonadales bacterium]|nr:hypothetical protein [Gemmatimonadales bacterium]